MIEKHDNLDLGVLAGELEENAFSGAPRCSLNTVGVIAHIHCLDSTVQLLKAIIDFGVTPSYVYVVPKPYSAIDWVIEEIKAFGINVVSRHPHFEPGHYDEFIQNSLESACKRLSVALGNRPYARVVLIDDGGVLSEIWSTLKLSPNVVSIQWTSSWQYRAKKISPTMPKIDVARSAAKRYFETPTIVQGVLNRVDSLGLMVGPGTVGVVGYGVLGSRLAKRLVRKDPSRKVLAFDRSPRWVPDSIELCSSLTELLAESDVILGCTGRDCLYGSRTYRQTRWSRTFISCSSRDIEFLSMVTDPQCKVSAKDGPFGTILVETTTGCVHHVENGGFPINFDRRREWEGKNEIFLTRCLIYLAFLQATRQTLCHPSLQKLTPVGQQYLVRYWLRQTLQRPEDFEVERAQVDALEWWARKSQGSL